MKIGIIVFPGSNCEQDCAYAVTSGIHQQALLIWHKETVLPRVDALILPGGFSYGDYLRCGAIARFSPIMEAVIQFAQKGGLVWGICNGFQILVEAGLLEGVLMRNRGLKFICETRPLKVCRSDLPFTKRGQSNAVYRMPIAHMEGNYFHSEDGLKRLQDQDQIVFQYVDEDGTVSGAANPNGSQLNIAGICNRSGNVLGMMPHPERVCEGILGFTDGRFMFESLLG